MTPEIKAILNLLPIMEALYEYKARDLARFIGEKIEPAYKAAKKSLEEMEDKGLRRCFQEAWKLFSKAHYHSREYGSEEGRKLFKYGIGALKDAVQKLEKSVESQ
jgi:hypothetical protein